jgi:hypothetical protein
VGFSASLLAGRRGLDTSSPPQFGQRPPSFLSAHDEQNIQSRPDALREAIAPTSTRHAKIDDGNTFHRLRSIPGVGKILALILLYEIHDIGRFPDAGMA